MYCFPWIFCDQPPRHQTIVNCEWAKFSIFFLSGLFIDWLCLIINTAIICQMIRIPMQTNRIYMRRNVLQLRIILIWEINFKDLDVNRCVVFEFASIAAYFLFILKLNATVLFFDQLRSQIYSPSNFRLLFFDLWITVFRKFQ